MSKVKPEYTGKAIYRSPTRGPYFGTDVIIFGYEDSDIYVYSIHAGLGNYYSVPPAVRDRYTVLAGTLYFSPEEVEVFYLDPSP